MKHQKLLLSLILLTLTFVSGAGCASGPELDKYPRREIDRPYTLPIGVTTFNTGLSYLRSSDDSTAGNSNSNVNAGFSWQMPLNDDWNLVLGIVGIEGVHQFTYDASGYTGITFGLVGVGYSSLEGALYDTHIEVTRLQRLSTDFALVPSFAVNDVFHTASGYGPPSLGAGFYLRALYQLTNVLALHPSFDIEGHQFNNYDPVSGEFLNTNQFVWTYTPEINLDWSVSRQFDLNFDYKHFGLGYPNGYVGNQYAAAMTLFW